MGDRESANQKAFIFQERLDKEMSVFKKLKSPKEFLAAIEIQILKSLTIEDNLKEERSVLKEELAQERREKALLADEKRMLKDKLEFLTADYKNFGSLAGIRNWIEDSERHIKLNFGKLNKQDIVNRLSKERLDVLSDMQWEKFREISFHYFLWLYFLCFSKSSIARCIQQYLKEKQMSEKEFCTAIASLYDKISREIHIPTVNLTKEEVLEGMQSHTFFDNNEKKAVQILYDTRYAGVCADESPQVQTDCGKSRSEDFQSGTPGTSKKRLLDESHESKEVPTKKYKKDEKKRDKDGDKIKMVQSETEESEEAPKKKIKHKKKLGKGRIKIKQKHSKKYRSESDSSDE